MRLFVQYGVLFFLSVGLLFGDYHYVQEPVVNMRKEPSKLARVKSQAIFAEQVVIVEKKEGWSLIETPDGVQGWVEDCALVQRQTPYEWNRQVARLTVPLYGVQDTEWGPVMMLPYGCHLRAIEQTTERWTKVKLPQGGEAYVQNGHIEVHKLLGSKKELGDLSVHFLGLPYIWGGRSSFGYDCSGFVQMLYSRFGINLPRNSKEQAIDLRFETVALEELESGDLIFWGRNGRICHVGLYLGEGKFIHSVAITEAHWLMINRLDEPRWSGASDSTLPIRLFRRLRT